MSGLAAVMDQAVRQVQEAVRLDTDGKHAEALPLYVDAIQRFLHVMKCTSTMPLAESRNAVRFPRAVQCVLLSL